VTWGDRVRAEVTAGAAETIGLLADLVRTPSITGSPAETALQHRLADDFAADGLEVDHWPLPLAELAADPDHPGTEAPRDEGWGLVGTLAGRGSGRSLMLLSHVDVVPSGDPASWSNPDPFSGHVEGGVLYGRGACDMKGGLAATILAVRALRRSGVPLTGDVLLAAVVSEEDGGLGAFATLRRGHRADACVIPEPTELDVVPAAAGALTFRLRVPGLAAHAARRTAGVSAVEKFWPLWEELAALETRRNVSVDPLMERWSPAYPLSIGIVRAGEWASTVPDSLVAEGRLGVALGETVQDAREGLERAVDAACARDPWLAEHPATVEWWGGQFAPGRLPRDSDLVERVHHAHAGAGGAGRETYGAPYGTDLRLLTGLGGIPTVHYGPGDAALAHARDEAVPIDEVLTCAGALALLALDICGVA
jgi:acetylornithine deacetylase